MTDRSGRAIMGANGSPIITREYIFKRNNGDKVIIQDHSAGHYYGEGGGLVTKVLISMLGRLIILGREKFLARPSIMNIRGNCG